MTDQVQQTGQQVPSANPTPLQQTGPLGNQQNTPFAKPNLPQPAPQPLPVANPAGTTPKPVPVKSELDQLKEQVSTLKARLAQYETPPAAFQEFPKVIYLHPKDTVPVMQTAPVLPGAQGVPVGSLVGSQPQIAVQTPKTHVAKVVLNAEDEKKAKAEGFVNQPFVAK